MQGVRLGIRAFVSARHLLIDIREPNVLMTLHSKVLIFCVELSSSLTVQNFTFGGG